MRRTLVVLGAGVAVVVLVVGLWAFQPWKAFTSSTLDEALPGADPSVRYEATVVPAPPLQPPSGTAQPGQSRLPGQPEPGPGGQPGPVGQPAQPAPKPGAPFTAPPAPMVLTQGDFVDQEHDTSGVAKVVKLADGSRLLRLEGFATSDGPDVHVWLTDQEAGGSWGKYDDGRSVQLGKLKATNGNQNYAIPADADLTGLRSVVIWCDRFNVAFGSAPLASLSG